MLQMYQHTRLMQVLRRMQQRVEQIVLTWRLRRYPTSRRHPGREREREPYGEQPGGTW